MSANYICPQNCNNFQHCCRISTKHIDAANSVNDDNDIQYKFCQHISIVNVSNILGAIVKNYVYPETNICLYLGENTTTTNNNTIKKYHYLHDQFIYIYHNRKYEILVKSIQVKLSIHPSIQPIQGSGLNSYKDYCILPETTETIGKLKQQLATKYGLQLTNLIMFLSDLTNNNFKRQLTDDMPIVFAWLYPNITDSCINILPQRYSSCTDCYDSCHQYYCRIDIKQIDPNNNNSSGGDEDIKYLFCRHTVRVAVEDIFKASVDGYSDTDISLEILSINNNTDNTIDDDNDNNDTNWWLTKDKSIDFTDYTVEQKQSGSIGFAVRAVRVRINVSLAALKQQSQGSTANQTYDILPIQTPTIGQLKHKLALKYMFATETHTLYLTDLSDTNAPQLGRQLNDYQSIANAWLYGTYSRSVITVIPNKGVKHLTEVINRSNDLILEKITSLLTANSGQSFRNQTADAITDAVINANKYFISNF
ncbi:uncharacterized protein LOC128959048 [Oppia nitens]|uniref:uncharacterized protein LOC128959048 n=1 Tax=Oppia nitens TaxID=1686743 RepID=UPI0023DA6273|nr:uncharacterized protein LOC128959048 [Oppia nitens]